jgi:hypothetical protein
LGKVWEVPEDNAIAHAEMTRIGNDRVALGIPRKETKGNVARAIRLFGFGICGVANGAAMIRGVKGAGGVAEEGTAASFAVRRG